MTRLLMHIIRSNIISMYALNDHWTPGSIGPLFQMQENIDRFYSFYSYSLCCVFVIAFKVYTIIRATQDKLCQFRIRSSFMVVFMISWKNMKCIMKYNETYRGNATLLHNKTNFRNICGYPAGWTDLTSCQTWYCIFIFDDISMPKILANSK